MVIQGISPDADVTMKAGDLQAALAKAERRGAARALRKFRDDFDSFEHEHDNAIVAAIADERAGAIEGGADL